MKCPLENLQSRFQKVRARTLALCEPLETEDFVVQSMDDASPVKWHLAHTTWFFETFILEGALSDYRPFHEGYRVLFNSYYNSVGPQFNRARRGVLSRPGVREIFEYRRTIENRVLDLFPSLGPELLARVELGLNHEEQHQELLLTDLKHALAQNPLHPIYQPSEILPAAPDAMTAQFVSFEGGLVDIGSLRDSFAFDNESPRHRVFLTPFCLSDRRVTHGDFVAFIADGGYERPELWLSEGWAWVQRERCAAPLYWFRRDDEWWQFTLGGAKRVEMAAPACHLSYFEADAFATWSEARLPTEAEWEFAMTESHAAENGTFLDDGFFHPRPFRESGFAGIGDVWEWTRSAYEPYPGFRPATGAIGEYNGKFMCRQMVLRGASCATPRAHSRLSYRNFFEPDKRWQFSGLRLAKDERRSS